MQSPETEGEVKLHPLHKLNPVMRRFLQNFAIHLFAFRSYFLKSRSQWTRIYMSMDGNMTYDIYCQWSDICQWLSTEDMMYEIVS